MEQSSASGRDGRHHRGSQLARMQGLEGYEVVLLPVAAPWKPEMQTRGALHLFLSISGGSDWLSPGKPHSLLRAAEEGAARGLVPLRTCTGTGILLRKEVPFVPTPTPNFTAVVTYSSLKDSFQANQFKSSWSVWAGGLLSSTSWRSQCS